MNLQQRRKALKECIDDFKEIGGYAKKITNKYEQQLKEVQKEIAELKEQRRKWKESQK